MLQKVMQVQTSSLQGEYEDSQRETLLQYMAEGTPMTTKGEAAHWQTLLELYLGTLGKASYGIAIHAYKWG